MAAIGRTASGTPHRNRIVLKRVKILFQRFPGTAGSDADRGISGVSFKLKVNGKVAARGVTAADGSVTVDVPVGLKARLDIFDTHYTIKVVNALESPNSNAGEQRRLQLLGYELGEVDGHPLAHTDNAALNFQADNNPLDTDGVINAATQNQLKTNFGE